jgi:Ca2+-binding RTX toxin-like protein
VGEELAGAVARRPLRTVQGEPYIELAVPLSPPARQALERDGRVRLASQVLHSGSAPSSMRTVSFVVVTRRPAPRPGWRGSLLGRASACSGCTAEASAISSAEPRATTSCTGAGGPDALHGGHRQRRPARRRGHDVLDGDDGDDALHGGPGADDLVEHRFGDDELHGGPGDDVVGGGRGHDDIHGDAGDDVLSGGSGPDRIWCGAGEDIAFANFLGERRNLDGCEHVYDEPGVVHVPCVDGGTGDAETVLGTEGDDRCDGRGGADDLEGRGGDDVLIGGEGGDRLFGRFGADRLLGGDGDDELEGGRGRDVLDGGPGVDQLNGGFDPDMIAGGPGADEIVARGGGADRIDCGPGVDVVWVDSSDRVTGCERVRRTGERPHR